MCIRVTLGNLAERGYLTERFDKERNELVYSLAKEKKMMVAR